VTAALADTPESALQMLKNAVVPVIVDPEGHSIAQARPAVVVDAILAKRNTGTAKEMAPLVVGLGPGFTAGDDVHAVVETNRGPDLGRVTWRGAALPNTGTPAAILGWAEARVLRAPAGGVLSACRQIGDVVSEGDVVATVAGEPVRASFHGVLRGLARDGLHVQPGLKIGDVDPRLDPTLCLRVSDKSLAIAGGVLEAILTHVSGRLV
jgi:xanthine dehydrogenase accessory factor